jgi:Flp pilus assembly protein TadD
MDFGTGWRQPRLLSQVFAGSLLALALAGCQTASTGPDTTGSIATEGVITASDLGPEEALGAVQKWGALYGQNERDKVAALNYAAALRGAGQTGQAVAVMRKAAIYHPQDREVLAAFGKALAADGKFKEALATVRRAQRADNPDWQLLSTEGGILDSVGKHEEARALYQQALVLAPGEPQILNNLGLSYVLTNELEKAEEILREAAENPKATRKIKENYALVLKLKNGEIIGEAPAGEAQTGAVVEEDIWSELSGSG